MDIDSLRDALNIVMAGLVIILIIIVIVVIT